MRTIVFLLLMVSTAFAGPCDDYKKRFERAKKFGAWDFQCVDNYDGSATSSFRINHDDYKNFIASELERNRKRVQKSSEKKK